MPFEFDLTNERTRYRAIILALAVLLCISLIALTIVSVKLAKAGDNTEETTTDSVSSDTLDTSSEYVDITTTAETEPPVDEKLYNSVMVVPTEMNGGLLALVDATHPFVSSEAADAVVVRSEKTSSYKVSDYNIKLRPVVVTQLNSAMDALFAATGCSDVMVSMAYDATDNTIDRATGLSFKLVVYDGKSTYRIITDTVEASSQYANVKDWLLAHMHESGFILRYPDEFEDVTGKSKIGALFRYVGVEAATAIKLEGTCLETFLTKATAYTYDKPWSIAGGDTDVYNVYYVPATADVTTYLVNVPAECESYVISGDNKGGFVVVVHEKVEAPVTTAPATTTTAPTTEVAPQN